MSQYVACDSVSVRLCVFICASMYVRMPNSVSVCMYVSLSVSVCLCPDVCVCVCLVAVSSRVPYVWFFGGIASRPVCMYVYVCLVLSIRPRASSIMYV